MLYINFHLNMFNKVYYINIRGLGGLLFKRVEKK